MPLDSKAYLTSLGWQGAGNGLREGGMIKPLSIPQKRTLAGIGKDRDEAFPFWDHVFSAAASSIKIKIHNDSDQTDAESEEQNGSDITLARTSTGIISNRRPATSGSVTPKQMDDAVSTTNRPRLSLLAEAKRQAARARLYASFVRGPVITSLNEELEAVNGGDEEKMHDPDTPINRDTPINSGTDIPSKRKGKSSSHDTFEKGKAVQSEDVTTGLENPKGQKRRKGIKEQKHQRRRNQRKKEKKREMFARKANSTEKVI